MDTQTNKKVSKLLNWIDKIGVLGAIVLIVLLLFGYFFAAYNIPNKIEGQPESFTSISLNLAMSLISGIIPVFILFIFSYALFREINKIKDEEKTSALVNNIIDKIHNIISKPLPDIFFQTKSKEENIIKNAKKELLFVQESGSLVSEQYRSELITFLQQGGDAKIVAVDKEIRISELMILRNTTLPNPNAFELRAKKFLEHMAEIIKSAKIQDTNKLIVRYISYPIDFTMVMNDSSLELDDEYKNCLVRLAGFKIPFEKKPDFYISRATSKRTFDLYKEQFNNLYTYSSQVKLIMGKPRSGKSTLFSNIQQKINKKKTFYVLSKQLCDAQGERNGFSIQTTNDNNAFRFATKTQEGLYDIEENILDEVAQKIEIAIADNYKIFLIDEIGPLQLRNKSFTHSINKLLDKSDITLFATIADDSITKDIPEIQNIKMHPRSEILSLGEEVDEIEKHIVNEIFNKERAYTNV